MTKSLLAWMVALAFVTLPAYGADTNNATTADVSASLEQTASEVEGLLVEAKVRNIFDLCRRLREYGMTWQPALTAPDDLVGKLDDEQLRIYAGLKLFDAVYAATFMQRQAVSDAVQTIEAIHEKLNLRAYADLSGNFFATLKKASAEPETVNVQLLLERLAADYVGDVPALMSNPHSADYLIDALYGFTIEAMYVLDCFYQSDYLSFRKGMRQQPDHGEWWETMDRLLKAFDRWNGAIRLTGKMTEKMAVMGRVVAAIKAGAKIAPDDAKRSAAWDEILLQVATIRLAALTPTR